MSTYPKLTVEERIEKESGQPVAEILERFAKLGKTSKQVADELNCGVSNVRRIARKYDISFNQQEKSVDYFVPEFSEQKLNQHNILSKAWNLEMKPRMQTEVV